MRRRPLVALTLLLAIAAAGIAVRTLVPANVSSVPLRGEGIHFGGWSGIDVSADGRDFWAVGDSGVITRGILQRRDGRLVAAEANPSIWIRGERRPRNLPEQDDAEGISVRADGSYLISYEGFHRVWSYAGWEAPATRLGQAEGLSDLPVNSGLEALAEDSLGRIYTLPELPRGRNDRFEVYRFDGHRWDRPFSLARDGLWRAVGADFGPDGRFYLLEREFLGFGFASRIRRFDLETGDDPKPGEVLYNSPPGRHGNLEGIAIWQDETGDLRAVMVADDNHKVFQRSEIVEVILPR